LPKFVIPAASENYVAPVTMDTALQPWNSGPAQKMEAPKAEAPKAEPAHAGAPIAETAKVAAQPEAVPVPLNQVPGQSPVPVAIPVAGATPAAVPHPGTAVTPMPRRFQRAPEPAAKLGTKRLRLVAVAAGAFLAAWIVSSFLTRDSLHASQKPKTETVAPAPGAPDARPSGDLLTLTPTEAAKILAQNPAEPPKKEPSVQQVLRSEVRPLWEAGRYADAMNAVDRILVQEPANAEARNWKKKILAAQEAEAAVK
jgi:hypothetical protein